MKMDSRCFVLCALLVGAGFSLETPALVTGAELVLPAEDGNASRPESDEGFRPNWSLGDTWVVEARYRNLTVPGDAWLPPVRWRFHVRARKEIAGEPCWMIHIVPLGRSEMKVQGVLWLSCRDLRPMQAADVFPVRGTARSKKRTFDDRRITPLFSEGSMIPYDFPLFPLADDRGERRSDGAGTTVSGEKAVSAASTVFVDAVAQSWRRIPGGFEILLNSGGPEGNVRQIWQPGYPWAVRHSGPAVEARLIEPMPTEDGQ